MEVRTLGIDLAKNLFHVHGVDGQGRTVVQRQLRRRQLLPFVAQLQPCLLAMEACGGADYWAREIAKRGHEVRLMSPRFVRPYVKSYKNDARAADDGIGPGRRRSQSADGGRGSWAADRHRADCRGRQRAAVP